MKNLKKTEKQRDKDNEEFLEEIVLNMHEDKQFSLYFELERIRNNMNMVRCYRKRVMNSSVSEDTDVDDFTELDDWLQEKLAEKLWGKR